MPTKTFKDELLKLVDWQLEQIAHLRPRLQEILATYPQIGFSFNDIVEFTHEPRWIYVSLWYKHVEAIGDDRPLAIEPTRVSQLRFAEVNVLGEIMASLLNHFPEFAGEFMKSDKGLLTYKLTPKEIS